MRRKGSSSAAPLAGIFTIRELLSKALVTLKHDTHVTMAAILVPPTMGPSAMLTDNEIVFGGIPDHHAFLETPIVYNGVSLGSVLTDRPLPDGGPAFLQVLGEHLYRHLLATDLERLLGRADTLLVGEHPLIRKALADLEGYAGLSEPVLLTGESGVGKELFAMALHVRSGRRSMPCVSCNCASFPNQDLLLSEIFGHERGSFTGAVRTHQGKLEQARGGTLFLDEIGDLSLEGQASLLRVLDGGEYYPLGSEKPKFSDIRLISATNHDLQGLIRQKRFREDLYYRIVAFSIHLPPLRERAEDIALLADYLILKFAEKNRREPKSLTAEALGKLETHPFPGNIRELDVILKKAFVASPGAHIGAEAVYLAPSSGEYPDRVVEAYESMVSNRASFWDAVKKPYLNRFLNREEMWKIVDRGLKEADGSFHKLVLLFNLKREEYGRFIAFLNRNRP